MNAPPRHPRTSVTAPCRLLSSPNRAAVSPQSPLPAARQTPPATAHSQARQPGAHGLTAESAGMVPEPAPDEQGKLRTLVLAKYQSLIWGTESAQAAAGSCLST